MPSEYVKQRWAEIKAEMDARQPAIDARRKAENKDAAKQRREARQFAPGYVYFLRAGNAVKIGFSTDVRARLGSLLTACPEAAFICKVIEGTVDRERHFHKRFAEYRIRGEWFELRGRLAKFLERDIHPIGLPDKIAIEPQEDFHL